MTSHNSKTDFEEKYPENQVENPTLTRLNNIKSKGRLSFITSTENKADTQFLTFRHVTKAQERTRKRQQPIKLEPLVSLETSILAPLGYRGSCKIALGDGSIIKLLTQKE